MAGSSIAAFAASFGTSDDNLQDDFATMWTCAPFSSSNALHRGLKEMEELLRCGMCQELMKIPASLPCQHTYCNHCIQSFASSSVKGMTRKANCPECRHEIDLVKSVTPNRPLENLILLYKRIRPQLKQALSGATTTTTAEVDNTTTSDIADRHVNSRRRKRSRPNYADQDASTEDDDEDCVVEEVLQPQDDNAPKPTKRHKISYHNKKKKQLKELCAQEGLPTDGTEDELKNRHRFFITLHNTECDSVRPRSKSELVRELLKEERARKTEAIKSRKDAKFMEQLKKNRESLGNGEDTKVVSGNAEFDGNWAGLTAQLKAREAKKKKSSNDDNTQVAEQNSTRNGSEVASDPEPASTTKVSSTQDSNTTPANPYAQPNGRSSTGSASSNSGVSSFLSTSNVATETPGGRASGMFLPGTNAPSTISKKNSQSFAFSQSPGLGNLANKAVESPKAADAGLPRMDVDNTEENAPENQPVEAMPAAKPAAKAAAKSKPKANKKTQASKAKAAKQSTTRSTVAPWNCPACTYLNNRMFSNDKCGMCQTKRPPPTAQTSCEVALSF